MAAAFDSIRFDDNVARFMRIIGDQPDFDVAGELFAQRIDWIELIKTLRAIYAIDILEAERLALANGHWRRWCERRINAEAICRKYALGHIRHNGDAALLRLDGDVVGFR